MISALLLVTTLIAPASSFGKENAIWQQLQKYSQANPQLRSGNEVEFSEIDLDTAAAAIHKEVGGILRFENIPEVIAVKDENGNPVKRLIQVRRARIENSSVGNILIKPEDNSLELLEDASARSKVIWELVSDPIYRPQIEILDRALARLQAAGAQGTSESRAVSLQVNLEIGLGKIENFEPQLFVELLRLYTDPQIRAELASYFAVPTIRQAYIQNFSPGVLARLEDPKYQPSLRALYDDLMYRQMYELMGFRKEAWSLPATELRPIVIAALKRELAEKGNYPKAFFQVIKLTFLKVSSALLFAFPGDPLNPMILETEWIKAIPAVEFRERNNDFQLLKAYDMSAGFLNWAMERSKAYGFLCSKVFKPTGS